jgi:trk system potassium uptake protein TrkA
MELWQKIMKEMEEGASTLSEKAEDWFKIGSERFKEGAEIVAEKAKEVGHYSKLKWTQYTLQNQLKDTYAELGGLVYQRWHAQPDLLVEGELTTLVEQIKNYQAELVRVGQEISIVSDSLRLKTTKDLETELAEGGGAVQRVVIPKNAAVCGKKVNALNLPAEALIGSISRGKEVIIPKGETEVQAEDKVTILGKPEAVAQTVEILTQPA